jgi:probable HAF family extracellular repeat protein
MVQIEGILEDINNNGHIAGFTGVVPNATATFWRKIGSSHVPEPLPGLGGTNSQALGMNDHDQVVGAAWNEQGQVRAVLWTFEDSQWMVKDLGTLGENSVAEGISNEGVIIGRYVVTQGETHAFAYSGGIMTDLNDVSPEPSLTLAAAYGINDHGTICASATGPNSQQIGLLLGP